MLMIIECLNSVKNQAHLLQFPHHKKPLLPAYHFLTPISETETEGEVSTVFCHWTAPGTAS
jgi:hypothetical protein